MLSVSRLADRLKPLLDADAWFGVRRKLPFRKVGFGADEVPVEELDPDEVPVEELEPDEVPVEELDPDEVPVEELEPDEVPVEELEPDPVCPPVFELAEQPTREKRQSAAQNMADERA